MPRYACPHCQSPTFDLSSKVLSSHSNAYTCDVCQAKCFTPPSKGSGVMVLNLFLLTAAGFAMSYWGAWWPALPGAVLVFGVWLFFVHLRPMQLVTPFVQSDAVGKALLVEAVATVVVGIASS